ncbi:MAG: hypothetical protein AB8B51_09690 [Sedimentitalea sp.]
MTLFLRGFLMCAVVLMPNWAGAWRAINQHEVFDVAPGVFEVVSRVGAGPSDYWCGAGDYVRRSIGAASNQRIYLYKAIGPSVARPGKKAVQFALSPPPGGAIEPGLTLSVTATGDRLSAAFAHQYCYGDDPFDPFRLKP